MAGDARVFDSGKETLFCDAVAVTDTAGLDFDSDRAGAGLGDVALHDFKRSFRAGNLHGSHFRHNPFSLQVFAKPAQSPMLAELFGRCSRRAGVPGVGYEPKGISRICVRKFLRIPRGSANVPQAVYQ